MAGVQIEDQSINAASKDIITRKYGCSDQTVRRVWHEFQNYVANNVDDNLRFLSKKRKTVDHPFGRPAVLLEELVFVFKGLIRENKGDITYRQLAAEMNSLGYDVSFQQMQEYSKALKVNISSCLKQFVTRFTRLKC